MTNSSDAFLVLKDCTRVLKYLYACEWIHRDISAGNVYFYEGRGLLGDFEYAKRMGSGGSHDMLTGTMDFMAVEVVLRGYVFVPHNLGINMALSALAREDDEPEQEFVKKKPDFRHNYAHDVESLWWLALFLLFFSTIKQKSEAGAQLETGDYLRDQEEYAWRIFPDRLFDVRDRLMFFWDEDEFAKGISWFPMAIAGLMMPLRLMRKVLVGLYSEFEVEFPQEDYGKFAELHDAFFKGFEKCQKLTLHIELKSLRQAEKAKETPVASAARDSKSTGKAPSEQSVQVPGTGKRKAYNLEDMPRRGKQLRLVSP